MCELLHAMAYLINFRVEKCEASSEIGCSLSDGIITSD